MRLRPAASPRSRGGPSCALPDLVEHEIAQTLAAIAQLPEEPLSDEIGEQERVARLDAVMDGIGGMPGVVADREGVARVRRKGHLPPLRHRAVREPLVEDGADVGIGVVRGKIELDRDALPMRVGVRRDPVSRYIARQNGDRIHPHPRIILAKAFFQPRRETPDKRPLDFLRAQRAADHVPQRALFRRTAADIFGEEVDLDARMRAVGKIVPLAAPVHGPIVARDRHEREHPRIDVLRKDPVEFEMVERLLHRPRRLDRLHDEIRKTCDRARAVVTVQCRGLVHRRRPSYLMPRSNVRPNRARRKPRHRRLKAAFPANLAWVPNTSSMRRSWLYLAMRSERASEPVLICPQLVATARSAMVESSVSPERCDMTAA